MKNDEDRYFSCASELEEWLVTARQVDESTAHEAAATLFENGFDSSSILLGITCCTLERNGLSIPVAMTLRNKLEARSWQQQTVTRNKNDEYRKFKSAGELQEWFVTVKRLKEDDARMAAATLFDKGYNNASTLDGITFEELKKQG